MRNKVRTIVLSLFVLIIVGMSVLLPYQMQLHKDQQILGLLHFKAKPLAIQEELPTLSMLDRLKLLSGEKVNTASIGKHSKESIKEQCTTELQLLCDKDIIPQIFMEMMWKETVAVAGLLLDAENVNQGMVLWTLTLSTDTAYLQCGMDDETGKILYLYFADDMGETPDLSNRQIEAFALYLGLEATTDSINLSTAIFTITSLPHKDYFDNDYQCVFSLGGEQIFYHVAKTNHGVFYGHNLVTTSMLPTYE